MTQVPETIYADNRQEWRLVKGFADGATEKKYIRADIHEALQAKCDAYEKALKHVAAYIHNYCIIVHPKENRQSQDPETYIKQYIDTTIANANKTTGHTNEVVLKESV